MSDLAADVGGAETRPGGGDAAIVIDHVSKRFHLHKDRAGSIKEALTYRARRQRQEGSEFWALRDITLDIPRGQTYGLIGHNGSGKSTLLRMIAGIHQPTSGTVTAHGRIAALLELGAGFHPELSGRENIYLNGSILGLKRREVAAVIDDIIDFSGISQFIDSPVKIYSSGMYVRLGFSVAVHVRPEILLIDEVIAVGDEDFQRRCFDHIYKLRREGVTIVFVSHCASLVESMCDRVAWLDHGHLLAEGDASAMMRKYMEKVNAEEAERNEGGDGVTSAHRRGTGEIRVDRLELLDGDGRPRLAPVTGEPLIVRVHFTAHQPVDDPVIGLGFRHESGAHIAGPNTRFGDIELGKVSGPGYVDYVLDPLPLMPGGYRFEVAVVDSHMQHTFDMIDDALIVRVQPGPGRERYGLVDLHGHWQVPTGSDSATRPPVG